MTDKPFDWSMPFTTVRGLVPVMDVNEPIKLLIHSAPVRLGRVPVPDRPGTWDAIAWTENGEPSLESQRRAGLYRLINIPTKRTVWLAVNNYSPVGAWYASELDADKDAEQNKGRYASDTHLKATASSPSRSRNDADTFQPD